MSKVPYHYGHRLRELIRPVYGIAARRLSKVLQSHRRRRRRRYLRHRALLDYLRL